jgi:prepilin-type N-terminal cleavage/methylation domain-containing protein
MKASGYTVIELVIVIVLLGILSATTLPRYIDSSDDARRALNNSTAAALNTALAGAIAAAKAPGAILNGSTTLNNTYPGYASTTTTTLPVINIDNNPNSALNTYISFYSSIIYIPIGAGRAPYSNTPTFSSTNYADISGGAANPPTNGCAFLFNALVGNQSVQAASEGVGNSSTVTYKSKSSGLASSPTYNGATFANASPTIVSTSITSTANYVQPLALSLSSTNPPAGSGVCLFEMNNTSGKNFYIFYDPVGMVFYAGES